MEGFGLLSAGCKNMPLPCGLTTGDSVEVQVDPDQFRVAQENHGGWNIQMAEVNQSELCR